MEWTGLDEANADQIRSFDVTYDESAKTMKFVDTQTQEEIVLKSQTQTTDQTSLSAQ